MGKLEDESIASGFRKVLTLFNGNRYILCVYTLEDLDQLLFYSYICSSFYEM